jgi:hypothetical protein
MNDTTAALYDLVAAALTELKTREDASGEGGLDLEDVHIIARYADIRWHAEDHKFVAVFYAEASAELASEETGGAA